MPPQNEPRLYEPGAAPQSLTTIWDRMSSRFQSTDFVRVMNIDDETFYWQSIDPRDEQHEIEGNQFMQHDNTIREKPKVWSIPAGGTMVLEGWNAYLMIEKLYKKVSAKHKLSNRREGQKEINFSWSTPAQQEEYIDKIFLGIEKPNFSEPQKPKQEAVPIVADESIAQLAKELDLDAPNSGKAS